LLPKVIKDDRRLFYSEQVSINLLSEVILVAFQLKNVKNHYFKKYSKDYFSASTEYLKN